MTQEQYSVPPNTWVGLTPLSHHLLQAGLPIPTHSPSHTPILWVSKTSWVLLPGPGPGKAMKPESTTPQFSFHLPIPSTAYCSVFKLNVACFFCTPVPSLHSSVQESECTVRERDTLNSQQPTYTVACPGASGVKPCEDLASRDVSPSFLAQYVDDLLLCLRGRQLFRTSSANPQPQCSGFLGLSGTQREGMGLYPDCSPPMSVPFLSLH